MMETFQLTAECSNSDSNIDPDYNLAETANDDCSLDHSVSIRTVSRTANSSPITCDYNTRTLVHSTPDVHHNEHRHSLCKDVENNAPTNIPYCTLSDDIATFINRKEQGPLECNVCCKNFTDKSNLRVHMRIHTGDRPFECDICHKGFNQNISLTMHKRTHTGEKPYECNICREGFNQKSNFARHMRRKHLHVGGDKAESSTSSMVVVVTEPTESTCITNPSDNRTMICDTNRDIKDEPLRVKIEPEIHDELEQSSSDCHISNTVYNSDNKIYIKDERIEAGQETFDVCTDSDIKAEALRVEIDPAETTVTELQQQYKDLKVHICSICCKGFTQRSNLTVHMRTHSGEKLYECDICHKNFNRKAHLTVHKRTHTGEKPYECDICHKGFSEKSKLTIHKRIHTGDKPYECDVCHNRFTRSTDLIVHQRIHNTDGKSYECDVCQKRYIQKKDLAVHMRLHTGEKLHECDICHKRITRKDHLIEHMRTHTGGKQYECDRCNKRYLQKKDLTLHMRLHTGDKVHECEVCHKRITRKDHLVEHMRTHTGEKPYACHVCLQKFSMKSQLRAHRLTKHIVL